MFNAKYGRNVTFGVRIVHPATGTVVLETSATSDKTSTAQQTMEIMPDTEMPYDGWYRFEPTEDAIYAIYPEARIVGHCELNPRKACPCLAPPASVEYSYIFNHHELEN